MSATTRAIEVAREKLVAAHDAGEHEEQVPNCPECNPDIVVEGSSGSGHTDGGEEERTKLDAKEPKASPKAKAPKEQPKPSAATVKAMERLREIAKELDRLDALREERTKLLHKVHEAKVPTKEISEASKLSVPRLRQVLASK